jgi:Zn finger protein HypA/HybF involved in hydrogenase expression
MASTRHLATTVLSRTDEDIRTLRLSRVMLICPKCESDRVISLTFPPDLGELMVGMPDRPVAKCADCGHELSAEEVTAQDEPSD